MHLKKYIFLLLIQWRSHLDWTSTHSACQRTIHDHKKLAWHQQADLGVIRRQCQTRSLLLWQSKRKSYSSTDKNKDPVNTTTYKRDCSLLPITALAMPHSSCLLDQKPDMQLEWPKFLMVPNQRKFLLPRMLPKSPNTSSDPVTWTSSSLFLCFPVVTPSR